MNAGTILALAAVAAACVVYMDGGRHLRTTVGTESDGAAADVLLTKPHDLHFANVSIPPSHSFPRFPARVVKGRPPAEGDAVFSGGGVSVHLATVVFLPRLLTTSAAHTDPEGACRGEQGRH